jgi:hypothetical protein
MLSVEVIVIPLDEVIWVFFNLFIQFQGSIVLIQKVLFKFDSDFFFIYEFFSAV